ncbi:hypothetical protein DFH09DRAFT_1101727 [Mycena vulgaris]|nr:hypothetical protein DFH09DRAFT_1101727 [Mycena vulgaris]
MVIRATNIYKTFVSNGGVGRRGRGIIEAAGTGTRSGGRGARGSASAPPTGTVQYSTPFSPPPDPRAAAAAAQVAQSHADRELSERDEWARDEERRRNGDGRDYGRCCCRTRFCRDFLAMASANTARNLETRGPLLGLGMIVPPGW